MPLIAQIAFRAALLFSCGQGGFGRELPGVLITHHSKIVWSGVNIPKHAATT